MLADSLPPPGFPFGLLSLENNQVLSAKDGLTFEDPVTESDDQLFCLVANQQKDKIGAYMIKSILTGEVFQLGDDSKLFLADPEGNNSRQWFTMHPCTVKSVAAISLRLFASPKSTEIDIRDDIRKAIIILQGVEVVSVVYDTSAGHVTGTVPEVIATQTVTNNTSVTQTPEANLTKSIALGHSFTYTAGLSLTVGAKFDVGVPGVAAGEISTSVTASQQFSWGETTIETTTIGQLIPVSTPPYKKIKATGTMKHSIIDVPCTIHWRAKLDHSITAESKLVYHGLSYWDFDTKYESV